MNGYNIRFAVDGEDTRVRKFKAINPGQAYSKCHEKYPKAKLIKAWQEGGYMDGYGITEWEPPSTIKIEAGPAPKEEQTKFSFYDEQMKFSFYENP